MGWFFLWTLRGGLGVFSFKIKKKYFCFKFFFHGQRRALQLVYLIPRSQTSVSSLMNCFNILNTFFFNYQLVFFLQNLKIPRNSKEFLQFWKRDLFSGVTDKFKIFNAIIVFLILFLNIFVTCQDSCTANPAVPWLFKHCSTQGTQLLFLLLLILSYFRYFYYWFVDGNS